MCVLLGVGSWRKIRCYFVIMENEFKNDVSAVSMNRLDNGKANKAGVNGKTGKLKDPHSGMIRLGMLVQSFSPRTKI